MWGNAAAAYVYLRSISCEACRCRRTGGWREARLRLGKGKALTLEPNRGLARSPAEGELQAKA